MALLLGEIIRRHARRVPDRVAYVVRGGEGGREVVTYREFDALADRMAGALASMGVGRHDRVAVSMLNNAVYPVAYFGAQRLGAVVVPVNFRYQRDEVASVLGAARPRVVLVDAACAEVMRDAPVGTTTVDIGDGGLAHPALAALLARDDTARPAITVDERDAQVVFYTSGTTGAPKGVVQTHRSYYLQAAQPALGERGTHESDIGLCMFPLFHMSGWCTSLVYWYARATVVILRQPAPVAVVQAIAEERATQFYGIPEVLRGVAALPDLAGYDLTSLRDLNSGTSAMSGQDVEAAVAAFGVEGIRVHYGSSEAGPVFTLPAAESRRRPSSVGRPLINVDAEVVDDEGCPVPPGEVGEIVVRSEFVMDGYFDDPEATERALRDGWFHTGDLATVDDDGFVYICGRLREVIRSGGETIYPEELERCIAELPGVAACAVVGVPDSRFGEAAAAAVVFEAGSSLGPAEVVAHCEQRLARFKRPRHIRVVVDLPRAPATAKVQKALVRQDLERWLADVAAVGLPARQD